MLITRILLVNLYLVLILEVPWAVLFGAKGKRKIITVVLANVVTNPLVVLCSVGAGIFFAKWKLPVIIVLEVFAFVTEGAIFSGCKVFDKRNPYIISLFLNAVSYFTGEIIELII